MKKPRVHEAEKYIENAILDFLALHDVFAWKVKTMGTYDVKLGRFRIPSKRYMKGVSDIQGIFGGRPLAIEVKSAKGVVSDAQKAFLKRFEENGGLAFVARSVEDVAEKLDL